MVTQPNEEEKREPLPQLTPSDTIPLQMSGEAIDMHAIVNDRVPLNLDQENVQLRLSKVSEDPRAESLETSRVYSQKDKSPDISLLPEARVEPAQTTNGLKNTATPKI